MSWFPSWIPRLPNLNLSIPSGLQGRFITFVLKKTLGHFLKPGQLDYRQIDSQIGSGYVQVNDLQLNSETINDYLRGLPIALQDGTISSVKVRIPWPNPLASTLGFSVKSVHLRFKITPVDESERREEPDLADSVASVAESFVQELSSKEEESLWQSFQPETAAQTSVLDNTFPGGLDSFTTSQPDTKQSDLEPAGVSVFANLIERLLARFEFDAQNIKITLIHPENISLTLSFQDIQYLTDTKGDSSISSQMIQTQGENRTLTVNGVSLALQDISLWMDPTLFSSSHDLPSSSASTQTSRPPSRASSTSSMDDEARFSMSQSLAVLPPRVTSPSSSVSSSMYESAISAPSSILPMPDITEETSRKPPRRLPSGSFSGGREEMILSFGSQPLVLRIRTCAFSTPDSSPLMSSPDATTSADGGYLIANLSIGIIACALRPRQILSLAYLVRTIMPCDDAEEIAASKPVSKILPPINAAAEIRACVILLISSPQRNDETNAALFLSEFFDHPLVPPRLENGYSRIHLDSLTSSLSPFGEKALHGQPSRPDPQTKIEFGINDFSIFFFNRAPHDPDLALEAFPLLITDPHICLQYPSSNNQMKEPLPTFDIINWTKDSCQGFATRLSQWRCKSSKGQDNSSHMASHIELKPSIQDDQIEVVDDLVICIVPLHIRIDLEYILHPAGPLSFYEELFLSDMPLGNKSVSSGTSIDVNHSDSSPKKTNMTENASQQKLRTKVNFSFIRLSIRCPPPVSLNDRSGILILDLRDVNLVLDPPPPLPTTRFAQWDVSPPELNLSRETVLFGVSFDGAFIAISLVNEDVATSFLSIEPIKVADDEVYQLKDSDGYRPALRPRIRIIKPNTSGMVSILAISVDLPSIHVHLDKVCFDALQYWADDVNQLLERLSGTEVELHTDDSRSPSLIGSRFLAKSRNSSATGNGQGEGAETVMKVSITQTSICIVVPSTDTRGLTQRPIYAEASDLDVLVELNAECKQQTILTVGIADLIVNNTGIQGELQRLFSLTSRTSLSTSSTSIIKLRFSSNTLAETGTKETRIKLTLCDFTYTFYPDMRWFSDLAAFAKNPPETFESVVPSDRTRISVKASNGSIRLLAPSHPGAILLYMQDLEFSTDVVGDSQDSAFHVLAKCVALLAIDDAHQPGNQLEGIHSQRGVPFWMTSGYALLAEFIELDTNVTNQRSTKPTWKVLVDRVVLHLHLCADSLTAVTAFSHDLGTSFSDVDEELKPLSNKRPDIVEETSIMSSVEDLAFKRMPEIGPAPDMISDDLPTNLDYLDESFGAAAGLRELVDEDLDQFSDGEVDIQTTGDDPHIVSRIGGETIKVFDSKGLDLVDDYFLSIPPEKTEKTSHSSDAAVSVRISSGSFKLLLYDGYDWVKTRKTIEEEVKEMRKRLAKIRQLIANGQAQEPIIEDTSALLFNSVHIGLEQDDDTLEEPSALIAAIDEELQDDPETASQSSWQSLHPPSSTKSRIRSTRIHGKRLTRSKAPNMEFSLDGLYSEFDQFDPSEPLVSRTFVTVKDLEILDHIKTSTWKKFLTDLRADSRGNIRETESNMVRIELQGIRPVAGNSAEEVRLRAKILPLRLYVDQDAVDFLKKFFSFKDPSSAPVANASTNEGETYIQLGEIFPIDLKLDYKPRRVDYRALKEGRTIELMNFFHFDGAEMTLRHITLAGVTGWPRFFEMLNDLWTPDVKATQLVEVISGVAPIRSMVNVGSGVADLILLPIAQYKKDGRIVRGVQKGATAFVKSTAIEAIKMGAKLATGTQVILEQAEGILGGQFEVPITAEPVQVQYPDEQGLDDEEDGINTETISKYAQQPADLREGVQSAYKSLQKNLNSAAQTILAVPMEVYERSGNEGPVRSVIRAVPIAVLKPMIGASEAVSKTLLGLHNTLDPNVRHENDAKYKLR